MGVKWQAAVGLYPHTHALRSGEMTSDRLRLVFADLPAVNRAFAPMVREARFDVSEMAIATFLQAKAHGKPLVLLPVAVAARFQESALLCRAGQRHKRTRRPRRAPRRGACLQPDDRHVVARHPG
jgi:4,5-dihydroxyphthalate decarboxylase